MFCFEDEVQRHIELTSKYRKRVLKEQIISLVQQIPTEVWFIIFNYLSADDLLSCRLVNKTWKEMCSDNYLWKQVFQSEYEIGSLPPFQLHLLNKENFSWFYFYFQKKQTTTKVKQTTELLHEKNTLNIEKLEKLAIQKQDEFYQLNQNASKFCKFCKKEYIESMNKVTSCIRHRSIYQNNRWLCCGINDHQNIGCLQSKHEANYKKGSQYLETIRTISLSDL